LFWVRIPKDNHLIRSIEEVEKALAVMAHGQLGVFKRQIGDLKRFGNG